MCTAPDGAEPFTFAAYGDQGTTAGAERIIARAGRRRPAFTFCLGDLCYADPSGGVGPAGRVDHEAWDRWLRMVRGPRRRRRVLPAVGNHEMETGMGGWGYDGFLTRVALPGNGLAGLPTTWSARWGNVALVAADANDVCTEITRNNGVSGGAQDAWLEQTLAGLRADPEVDWIVVGFHHCAYCTNTLHGSDAGVRRWTPLFDRYGVDLVVNGHNHCYERTHPVRAGMPVAEVRSGGTWGSAAGVTYLCAGGGGGKTFPMWVEPMSTVTVEGGERIPELAPWSAARYNDHSLLLIDVDPAGSGGTTTLTVRAVSATGAEFDRVTLLRRRDAAFPPNRRPLNVGPVRPAGARPEQALPSVVQLQRGAPLAFVGVEPAQLLSDKRLIGGRPRLRDQVEGALEVELPLAGPRICRSLHPRPGDERWDLEHSGSALSCSFHRRIGGSPGRTQVAGREAGPSQVGQQERFQAQQGVM